MVNGSWSLGQTSDEKCTHLIIACTLLIANIGTVGFYGPKSRVSARGDHAARVRTCQDEGAPSREGQKSVPRGVFAASLAWRLGLFGGSVFSWRLGFFQGGKTLLFRPYIKRVKPRF